jgi:hypothetical protein
MTEVPLVLLLVFVEVRGSDERGRLDWTMKSGYLGPDSESVRNVPKRPSSLQLFPQITLCLPHGSVRTRLAFQRSVLRYHGVTYSSRRVGSKVPLVLCPQRSPPRMDANTQPRQHPTVSPTWSNIGTPDTWGYCVQYLACCSDPGTFGDPRAGKCGAAVEGCDSRGQAPAGEDGGWNGAIQMRVAKWLLALLIGWRCELCEFMRG